MILRWSWLYTAKYRQVPYKMKNHKKTNQQTLFVRTGIIISYYLLTVHPLPQNATSRRVWSSGSALERVRSRCILLQSFQFFIISIFFFGCPCWRFIVLPQYFNNYHLFFHMNIDHFVLANCSWTLGIIIAIGFYCFSCCMHPGQFSDPQHQEGQEPARGIEDPP